MAGVIYIELDSFFASVEQLKHPEHEGKPIAVGAEPTANPTGVISSVNEKARAFGIKKGMPAGEAYKIHAECIFLPVDFAAYRKVSSRVHKIISSVNPRVERVSIDEFFASDEDYEGALRSARQIIDAIGAKEGIGARAGVGPNKLIARMAVRFTKEGRIGQIGQEQIREKIWPLKTGRLPGVGKKTEKKLSQVGIKTIGQLANSDVSQLVEMFGEHGYELGRMANGLDEQAMLTGEDARSISREVTFSQGTEDHEAVLGKVEQLCSEISKELSSANLSFRTIGVKLRYDDMETHTRSRTIHITNSHDIVRGYAKDMIAPFLGSRKKIRLVGVKVDNIIFNRSQRSLLDFPARA